MSNLRVCVEEDNKLARYPTVTLRKFDVPETVANDELLVRIFLRPINPADIACVGLSYPGFQPLQYPATPGIEGVGHVVKAGRGAAGRFTVGDRVIGVPWRTKSGNGSWQQYAVISQADAVKMPDCFSDETAAQFWVNPATAFAFLDILKVPEGEFLIQSAAASTLGKQVILLAKHFGIKTINLVRRASSKTELLRLGADVVVDTSSEVLSDVVDRVTGGHGAFAGLDAVAGTTTGLIASGVRFRGQVVAYGTLSANNCTTSMDDIIFRDIKLRGFWLNLWLGDNVGRRHLIVEQLMQLLRDGIITTSSGERYPLEEVQTAIAASQKHGREGKVFLVG